MEGTAGGVGECMEVELMSGTSTKDGGGSHVGMGGRHVRECEWVHGSEFW